MSEREIDRLKERVGELERILTLAGAKERPDGSWVWPYYYDDGEHVRSDYMGVAEWKERRLNAAQAMGKIRKLWVWL